MKKGKKLSKENLKRKSNKTTASSPDRIWILTYFRNKAATCVSLPDRVLSRKDRRVYLSETLFYLQSSGSLWLRLWQNIFKNSQKMKKNKTSPDLSDNRRDVYDNVEDQNLV